MEKNACKRIKDKMERLTQEVDERYRAERETPTRVHTSALAIGGRGGRRPPSPDPAAT